jgi:hypothetical protein
LFFFCKGLDAIQKAHLGKDGTPTWTDERLFLLYHLFYFRWCTVSGNEIKMATQPAWL